MSDALNQMTWEELCTEIVKQRDRAEAAEDRCDDLEAQVRGIRKTVKKTIGRVIAEWSTRAVMKILQPTLVETIFAAIDAVLAEKPQEGKDA